MNTIRTNSSDGGGSGATGTAAATPSTLMARNSLAGTSLGAGGLVVGSGGSVLAGSGSVENSWIGVDADTNPPRFGMMKTAGAIGRFRTTGGFLLERMSGANITAGSATTLMNVDSSGNLTVPGGLTATGLNLSMPDPSFVAFDRVGFVKQAGGISFQAYCTAGPTDFLFRRASGSTIDPSESGQTYTSIYGVVGDGSYMYTEVPFRLKSYTVATLPTAGTAARTAYASNGRKNGEGAAAGTGVLVFDDGSAWRAVDTGATVAA